jgi:hypothetical protein
VAPAIEQDILIDAPLDVVWQAVTELGLQIGLVGERAADLLGLLARLRDLVGRQRAEQAS